MLKSILRVGRFLTVMTTLLALLVMATSAQAARFRRGWDPLFNASFSSSLGWRGEAEIFVTDLCVVAGATVNFPSGGGSTTCGTAYIESYTLEFYDIGAPLVNLYSASDTSPGSPLFPAVQALHFDGGAIADGVALWGEIEVTPDFAFGSTNWTPFLNFGFGFGNQQEIVETSTLRLRDNCNQSECFSIENDSQNYEPLVEWSLVDDENEVPTPAPLALLGIGLFALSMIRRRKA